MDASPGRGLRVLVADDGLAIARTLAREAPYDALLRAIRADAPRALSV